MLYMDKVDSNEHLKIGNTLDLLCPNFLIVKVGTTRLDYNPHFAALPRPYTKRLLDKTECLMVGASVAFSGK